MSIKSTNVTPLTRGAAILIDAVTTTASPFGHRVCGLRIISFKPVIFPRPVSPGELAVRERMRRWRWAITIGIPGDIATSLQGHSEDSQLVFVEVVIR